MSDEPIVIVGGGFGGVRCALDLEKRLSSKRRILLISDKSHFEYYPALYRVVAGRSPLEVCIPLREIFVSSRVEVVEDYIVEVDLQKQVLRGSSGSRYMFGAIVLALGSQTRYFDIPGLEDYSFGFKSIVEALRLRQHLHEVFERASKTETQEDDAAAAHIVVVGGGASGVEVAGELGDYVRKLARDHGVDPSLVTVDLIEAAPRILPTMSEDISRRASDRLRHLNINVFVNRAVVREEVEEVFLKDMRLKTKTVIWSAGVQPNALYKGIEGLSFDIKGRVLVDQHLQARGRDGVFVIGDAAAMKYAGTAQAAIRHAEHVSRFLAKRQNNNNGFAPFKPQQPNHAIPIGPGWALVVYRGHQFHGRIGWWLRRLADLRFFWSILPPRKAITAFLSGRQLCESCGVCSPEESGLAS